MKVNDGNGLFDKFGMIDEILRKMDALAETKGVLRGVLRCGLIWDISGMLIAMKDGLKKEDEATAQKIEELKRIVEEANK